LSKHFKAYLAAKHAEELEQKQEKEQSQILELEQQKRMLSFSKLPELD